MGMYSGCDAGRGRASTIARDAASIARWANLQNAIVLGLLLTEVKLTTGMRVLAQFGYRQ